MRGFPAYKQAKTVVQKCAKRRLF